jgi:hypothetical protein
VVITRMGNIPDGRQVPRIAARRASTRLRVAFEAQPRAISPDLFLLAIRPFVSDPTLSGGFG